MNAPFYRVAFRGPVVHHHSMAESAKKQEPATMADLEALPANIKGEIIDGVLHTQPRPRAAYVAMGSPPS